MRASSAVLVATDAERRACYHRRTIGLFGSTQSQFSRRSIFGRPRAPNLRSARRRPHRISAYSIAGCCREQALFGAEVIKA
jgi:hypothetical protein